MMSDPFGSGAEARRNIILSHGGKHGPSQTYLRGAPLSPEAAAHVPKDQGLITPANTTVAPPEPAPTTLAPVTILEAPAATPPTASPVSSVPSVITADAPAVTGNVGSTPPAKTPMPTNVRELHALNKDELVALALDLGVGTDGEMTVKTLREALKTAMEF